MNRIGMGILVLVFGLSVVAAQDAGKDKSATPAEQYKALVKEFYEAANLHFKATTDEERSKVLARVDKLSPHLLELAEKNPGDPIAIDVLVQAVNPSSRCQLAGSVSVCRFRGASFQLARLALRAS